MMLKKLLLAGAALAFTGSLAQAAELQTIGVTLGSLGNPFFVAMVKGVNDKAKQISPDVKVTAVSADYDLNKQFTQIDNFIAAGANLILLNAVDARAILPAVKRAQAAGITVVAVDVAANGADATVQTNNVKAGAIACQYIVDKLKGKGDVIIENGPQVSSVVDRVNGCKQVFDKAGGIKILSDNQNGQGSREGGLSVMQGLLTRYQHVDAVFTINDPQAIGSNLAAKQLNRTDFFITSVDGAPDIEQALKSQTLIEASASQDPYVMAQTAVQLGSEIMNGKKPAEKTVLLDPKLITRQNIDGYKGWTSR